MLNIDIINEQAKKEITEDDHEIIKLVITKAAGIEGILNGEVVVTLVDNAQIHELNLTYRGIDRPTDVLSFAMTEQGEDEPEIIYNDNTEIEAIPVMLGDIIISIPKAIEQAKEYGHSFVRELGFLTVHGFLHLIGYDHETEEDEKLMLEKQEVVLQQLNIIR